MDVLKPETCDIVELLSFSYSISSTMSNTREISINLPLKGFLHPVTTHCFKFYQSGMKWSSRESDWMEVIFFDM